MKLKGLPRLGILGATVAALLGALVIFVPTSASAAIDWDCRGDGVKRCIAMTTASSDGDPIARAKIFDKSGGRNFRVWVSNVRLQVETSNGWKTVKRNADLDGSHAYKDYADTTRVDECNWPNKGFRVKADYYWTGASTGHGTRTTPRYFLHCP